MLNLATWQAHYIEKNVWFIQFTKTPSQSVVIVLKPNVNVALVFLM